jgi:outer membrane protein
MKQIKLLLFGLLITGYTQAQTAAPVTQQAFTLEQAQKYAAENSPILKNSMLDLKIAEKKVWETTAMGLPHVSGKVSSSYSIELSPTIEQFSSFGDLGSSFGTLYGMEGIRANDSLVESVKNTIINKMLDSVDIASKAPKDKKAIDEMRWSANFDLTVSQLIFSGAYLVGLQTTKAFKGMSELAITKSKKDLEESVSNAYYLVLVMNENQKIMEEIYDETMKTVKEMEAMYKSGFVEETTVDQMKLTANNLKNTLVVIKGQAEVAKNLLRFQMGYNMNTDIILTDNLDNLMAQTIKLTLLSETFNVNNNTDFKMIQTQTEFSELQLKLQKSAFLPDVAAFYQYDHNFNDKAMSFTPPQIVGASVNIPIFGSGDKMAKVSQAKMNLDKSKNTEYQISQGLELQFSQAQTGYSNALNKLDANQENLDLAKRIYDKTLIKFKNGVSTSMELTQAQSQYLQAESTYYTTVIELVNAKNTLEKLLK